MRLICPNCGAQYEVPDDVIPEGGRDVQCSNCSHTWLETPGASERREMEWAEAAEEISSDAPYDFGENNSPNDPETAAPQTLEDAQERADKLDEQPYDDEEEEPEEEPAERQIAPRRGLDPSIAEILRAEAARETAQRAAEAEAFEDQPELGLQPPTRAMPHRHDVEESSLSPEEQRNEEARRRMARLRGEAVPPPSAPHAHRSELLPDIEEINSTLRSTAERTAASVNYEEELPEPRKSGFGVGFFTVIILALLAVAVYALAEMLGEMIPALKGPLTSYAAIVDSLRIWLDAKVQSLVSDA